MNWLAIAIISFALGALFGWVYAHSTVATECRRLGSFYAGDDVFHCTKITKFGEKEDGIND